MTNNVFLPGDWITIKNVHKELIEGCYGINPGTFEVIEYNKDCMYNGLTSTDPNIIFVQCNESVWAIAGSFKEATGEEIQTAKLLKTKNMINKRLDKLPKSWHVIVTEENREVLFNWRGVDNATITIGMFVGICETYNNKYEQGHNPGELVKGKDYDFGKEISVHNGFYLRSIN